ncbi:eukaryotic translation initiation factor 4 gamma-like [Lathyrus oleraceus]|uniref:eukaryotic translation initiation factor 4 gamma-like n=1 Tax=Pisum sativum TaxID=3888 RepID=UPI0021D3D1AB|nr:eukaryotic translation initiation factor 4 gamma-like [Pisum sativum]
MYYLDDLRKQGVEFSDWLPQFPLDFMKRPQEPSEKAKQAKKAKLGEYFGSRPPVPLTGSSGKSVSLPPSVQVKPVASSIPQPTPIYTNSKTPPSTTRPSNQPSQKFNLATTSLPISEAERLNKTTSPSSSSSPKSPPYYTLSSDTEPSDPHSPTLAQLQTRALASQLPTQSIPEPEVTSSPTEDPNTTTSDPPPSEPIHAETQPPNSEIPPLNRSTEPQTPTLNLSPPTSPPQASEPENTLLTLEEAIKVFAEASVDKGLSEQVHNDFIKNVEIRLQEHLAREAEERAHKEAEEKGKQEELQRLKEAEAKALAEVAAAAEAEATTKAAAEEAARLAEESAARVEHDALTQGESSTFVPLVLKTLEELQKEQQEVRARLDQQDSVNINI